MVANNYSLLLWRIDKVFPTKKAFCESMGISSNTLKNYISGQTDIPSGFIAKACEQLSIPQEEIGLYFFTKDEDFCTQKFSSAEEIAKTINRSRSYVFKAMKEGFTETEWELLNARMGDS